jgi:F-type H+-transporting ATPase subunit b
MEINATLIGQLITFAILVWFIMKYVWPPITKAMQERERKIAAGLEAAERSKRELAETEHKVIHMLDNAKREAQLLIDQAHKRSAEVIEEAKVSAKVEGQRMIDHAKDEIHREVNHAKEVLRKQLASLAVAGAEKIIKRNLDVNIESALLDELVAEI